MEKILLFVKSQNDLDEMTRWKRSIKELWKFVFTADHCILIIQCLESIWSHQRHPSWAQRYIYAIHVALDLRVMKCCSNIHRKSFWYDMSRFALNDDKRYFEGEIIFTCIHIICFIKLQQLTHNCWICINAGMQVMKVSDNLIHEQPCSPGEMNNMQIHHSSCPPFLYDDISKSIQ